MSVPICKPCLGIDCFQPNDLAAGIDSAIYSALDYSFIVECPNSCYCPPGLFPRTISILASVIPPVIVPIDEGSGQIILRLQGCQSLITRTLPFGATQAELNAAAQSMQAQWAGEQSVCNALLVPGVNCNTGSSISVCNDAQHFVCTSNGVVTDVPAGTICDTLQTAGLTSDQIAAAIAVMKVRLNNLAISRLCPFNGIICPITELMTPGVGAANIIQINVHNVSAVNSFDSDPIVLCLTGKTNCNPFHFGSPVLPGQNTNVTGGAAANYATSGFEVYYFDTLIFTDPNAAPTGTRFVTIQVGCGG